MLLFLFLSFLSLFPSSLRNPVVHDRAPSARNVSVSCVRSQCRLTASDSNDAPETRGKKLIFQERVSREREGERPMLEENQSLVQWDEPGAVPKNSVRIPFSPGRGIPLAKTSVHYAR